MKKLSLDELGRMSVDAFRESQKTPVCLVLDNLRSLHNVGSAYTVEAEKGLIWLQIRTMLQ